QASTTMTIPPQLTTVTTTAGTTTTTATTTTTTTTTTAAVPDVPYTANAAQALQDMYNTWWTDTPAPGHIVQTGWGYPRAPGTNTPYDNMIWAFGMMCSGIFTQWAAAPSDDIKNRLQAQYNWMRANVPGRTGNFGQAPHIAVDDCAWSAMYFVQTYLITGDTRARDDALALIPATYNYFKAGDTKNGLWYPSVANGQNYKSIYETGLIVAVLDLMLDAKAKGQDWQTEYASLYGDTLNVYKWLEANMLRAGTITVTWKDGTQKQFTCNDNLYWCDYNVNRDGPDERTGPDGASRPNWIHEADSVSNLLGNMGMAVCHALFYKLTGDTTYRDRALRTAKAITDSPYYNINGVLLDDRDGWTNGIYFGRYVQDVLTLPGIRTQDKNLIFTTAASAYTKCRVQTNGKWYYKAEWSGGFAWENNGIRNDNGVFPDGTRPEQIMTSGSTANVIIAAGLLETLQAQGKA
ncbi:MAG: hypothetical protein FWF49_00970, partial [Oscillospiraceae bacterium]|nr:hypothetical protein [Oscillospiraceae bacterium]